MTTRGHKRYRLMMLSNPVGPWRPTRADVQADAIEAGMADWDDAGRVLYLTVPAWIQTGIGAPLPASAPIAVIPVRRRAVHKGGSGQPLRQATR